MFLFSRPYRRPVIIAVHVLLAALAYYAAFVVRFLDSGATPHWVDGVLPLSEAQNFVVTVAYAVGFKVVALGYFQLYQGFWRYTSVSDLMRILQACSVSTVALITSVMLLRHTQGYPRSVFLLDWLFSVFAFGGIRLLVRLVRESYETPTADGPGRRTLIVGAGDNGEAALRELRKGMRGHYAIVGFLDDNPEKHGLLLHGVKVIGATSEIGETVRRHNVEEVLFAMPSASKRLIRDLVEKCAGSQVHFRTLPNMGDYISGRLQVPKVREVQVEDLLGRDTVTLERTRVQKDLCDRCVLVTGAGGSIGSELVRQIAGFRPARLVLVDIAESALFEIDRQLAEQWPGVPRVPVLGDITQRERMDAVFREHRPARVFHAAAFKHVPLMERYPVEAVLNNVTGTRVVAEAALACGTEKFVLISTDKAVHPCNAMGASKRCAELLLGTLAGPTQFVAVRFGNVLGSNGSVVPVFRQQIAAGGPVRITHPEMTRYFMTIPEAVELVLQAGALGHGGEKFVLDMGEPVSILALARNMIELSGLRVGEDIAIEFTGLRPGEKLHEELVIAGEDVTATDVPKVFAHQHPMQAAKNAGVAAGLRELETAARDHDVARVRDLLFALSEAEPRPGAPA